MTASSYSLVVAALLLSAGCEKKTVAEPVPTSGDVKIEANQKGYVPPAVALKKGAPARLIFTRTSDDTCATEVVFPELKIKKDLPLNTPVTVDVPTDSARTLTFACGMDMFKGSVVVK
jgi:plastocyanin domain-containing protein